MKKRGISLISVSVAVVIMIILISVVSVSLKYSITNAKKMTFANEIYNIQNLVDEYVEREGTLPNSIESITIVPTDLTQFEGENIVDNKIILDIFDLAELDIKNSNYGNKTLGATEEKAKDIYAVSKTTGKVYYIAGFESGGKKYYTLTDELKQIIEKNQNISIGENSITFTPSKIGWSNEGITVTVFVPEEFTSPSISVSNNITYTSSSVTGGTSYVVNNSKAVKDYTITVNYTKNGISSSAKYQTKIDTVAPIIVKNTSVTDTTTHIKGFEAIDENSGIKYFKYAQGVIGTSNVKQYMHVYGKNINKGSVKFVAKTSYTLYAEDKAGNYEVMYINEDGKLTDTPPDEYPYPVIPKGFVASPYSGEQKVSDGLVIYALNDEETAIPTTETQTISQTTRNQFVWIPVPDITKFKTTTTFDGTTITPPDSYSEPITADTALINASTVALYESEITQYNKMKESVEKYGGFYIGRYESGYPDDKIIKNMKKDGSDKPLIIKGVSVWNYIEFDETWEMDGALLVGSIYYGTDTQNGCAKVAKSLYNTDSVASHLIYGVEWDAIMNFIRNVPNPNVSGARYISNPNGMGHFNSDTLTTTGSNENYKVKNMYDLAGNANEWTYEVRDVNLAGFSDRAKRGGVCTVSGISLYTRTPNAPNSRSETSGFRVALYLK